MYAVLVSVLLPLLMYQMHRTFFRDPRRWSVSVRRRACVDVMSSDDAVHLVRSLSSATSDTNEIAERVERTLRRFPPDERVMRRLSTFQQRVHGEGGEREFCVVTVFMIASLCIGDGVHRPLPPRRTNSLLHANQHGTKQDDETREHGTVDRGRGRLHPGRASGVLDALDTHSEAQPAASKHKFHSESSHSHSKQNKKAPRAKSLPTLRSDQKRSQLHAR